MALPSDTVSLRITLRYKDLDEFVSRYAENISSAGLFLRTKSPKPTGTKIRFELLLADGGRALRGEGVVVTVRQDEKPGMALRFNKLDAESQSVIDRIVANHGQGSLAPTPLSTSLGGRTSYGGAAARQASTPAWRQGSGGTSGWVSITPTGHVPGRRHSPPDAPSVLPRRPSRVFDAQPKPKAREPSGSSSLPRTPLPRPRSSVSRPWASGEAHRETTDRIRVRDAGKTADPPRHSDRPSSALPPLRRSSETDANESDRTLRMDVDRLHPIPTPTLHSSEADTAVPTADELPHEVEADAQDTEAAAHEVEAHEAEAATHEPAAMPQAEFEAHEAEAAAHEDEAAAHDAAEHEDEAAAHDAAEHEDEAAAHDAAEHEDEAAAQDAAEHEDQAAAQDAAEHEAEAAAQDAAEHEAEAAAQDAAAQDAEAAEHEAEAAEHEAATRDVNAAAADAEDTADDGDTLDVGAARDTQDVEAANDAPAQDQDDAAMHEADTRDINAMAHDAEAAAHLAAALDAEAAAQDVDPREAAEAEAAASNVEALAYEADTAAPGAETLEPEPDAVAKVAEAVAAEAEVAANDEPAADGTPTAPANDSAHPITTEAPTEPEPTLGAAIPTASFDEDDLKNFDRPDDDAANRVIASIDPGPIPDFEAESPWADALGIPPTQKPQPAESGPATDVTEIPDFIAEPTAATINTAGENDWSDVDHALDNVDEADEEPTDEPPPEARPTATFDDEEATALLTDPPNVTDATANDAEADAEAEAKRREEEEAAAEAEAEAEAEAKRREEEEAAAEAEAEAEAEAKRREEEEAAAEAEAEAEAKRREEEEAAAEAEAEAKRREEEEAAAEAEAEAKRREEEEAAAEAEAEAAAEAEAEAAAEAEAEARRREEEEAAAAEALRIAEEAVRVPDDDAPRPAEPIDEEPTAAARPSAMDRASAQVEVKAVSEEDAVVAPTIGEAIDDAATRLEEDAERVKAYEEAPTLADVDTGVAAASDQSDASTEIVEAYDAKKPYPSEVQVTGMTPVPEEPEARSDKPPRPRTPNYGRVIERDKTAARDPAEARPGTSDFSEEATEVPPQREEPSIPMPQIASDRGPTRRIDTENKKDKAVVGLDLGGQWIRIGTLKNNALELLPAGGGVYVPAVVAVRSDGTLATGQKARTIVLDDPARGVSPRAVLRAMRNGRIDAVRAKKLNVIGTEGDRVQLRLGERVVELQKILVALFDFLRISVATELGSETFSVAISVPDDLDPGARRALQAGCRGAGLDVARLVTESEAMLRAYNLEEHPIETVLTVDVGLTHTGVTVARRDETGFVVKASKWTDALSARSLDNRVVDLTLEELREQTGEDHREDRAARVRLEEAVERARLDIRRAPNVDLKVTLPAPGGASGVVVERSIKLPRSRIYQVTEDVVRDICVLLQDVLREGEVDPRTIGATVLAGSGGTFPPLVQAIASLTQNEPLQAVPTAHVFALGLARSGLAIQRENIASRPDTLNASIGIGLPGGRFRALLNAGSHLPTTLSKSFPTTKDSQTEIELKFYQGDAEFVRTCTYLGEVTLRGLPRGLRGETRIDLQISVAPDGVLSVVVSEKTSGARQQLNAATAQTPQERRREVARSKSRITQDLPEKGGFFSRLFGRR